MLQILTFVIFEHEIYEERTYGTMLLSKKAEVLLNGKAASKYKNRKTQNMRCIALQLIFVLLFSVLFYRLWELQILNGQNRSGPVLSPVSTRVGQPLTKNMQLSYK